MRPLLTLCFKRESYSTLFGSLQAAASEAVVCKSLDALLLGIVPVSGVS